MVSAPRYRWTVALAPLLATTLMLAACGGDDETTTAASGPSRQSTGSSTDSGGGTIESGAGEAGRSPPASEQFRDPLGGEPPPSVEKIAVPPVPKGGDDSVQTFGKEAGPTQSAEAAQTVKGFFQGRADGRWADACYYLSSEMIGMLTQGAGEDAGCISLLRSFSRNIPRRALKRATRVRVGSVRIDGDRGFVVYKGAGGKWYAVLLSKENGEWKLGALAGALIP
jgi:hypothetical protein